MYQIDIVTPECLCHSQSSFFTEIISFVQGNILIGFMNFDYLRFYRRGSIHVLSHLCSMHIHEDLEYWGIDKNLMDACCALTHYPELSHSQKEAIRDQKNRLLEAQRAKDEDFGMDWVGKCRSFLWNMTEYPERSTAAKVSLQ